MDEKQFWLINLYGPNQDDPYFFENVYTNLLNLQATNNQIIMIGDYNRAAGSLVVRVLD